MAMPRNLVFVRHGQSEGNVAHHKSRKGDHSAFSEEFQNRHSSTWRLTDLGKEQAIMAGDHLKTKLGLTHFDRYYVSEYIRAIETAMLLDLPGANWFLEMYLREHDFGDWDVISEKEKKKRHPWHDSRYKIDGFFWSPPNGESMADVCIRVDRVLQTLHRECSDHNVIVVCHGNVIRAFRVRLERMTQQRYHEIEASNDPKDFIGNCQILHYTREDPETGQTAPYFMWMRSICPTDLSRSRNIWEPINRQTFNNNDLKRIVDAHPRVISG